MRLKIHELWSPDIPEAPSGLPPDHREFSVFMQVAVSQRFHRGHEVFQFFACSPGRSRPEQQPVLEFEEFDWEAIRKRITSILTECHSCRTWDEVIAKLSRSLEYSDR
jgi:hypothetical protein